MQSVWSKQESYHLGVSNVQNKPLVKSKNIIRNLYIKLGLMRQYVKIHVRKSSEGSEYVKIKFQNVT